MRKVKKLPYILNKIMKDDAELTQLARELLQIYENINIKNDIDMSFVSSYPPGHFYSPLPSTEEVLRVSSKIWGKDPSSIAGINLRIREQQRLFAKFLKYYPDVPFTTQKVDKFRYYFDNVHFCHADAIILYCALREFRPSRVIEVGSGFSSCVMLDTNQYFLENSTSFTFIEPNPNRLLSNMTANDVHQTTLINNFVQDVDPAIFDALQENDILFLDCSHVGKIGSDVLYLLFEILPRLSPGVIIHFHDIFYPFEYPRQWVENSKRAWNEAYFIRAFLQFNQLFEIIYFNNYLGKMHRPMLEKHMPMTLHNIGGSLWLKKTA